MSFNRARHKNALNAIREEHEGNFSHPPSSIEIRWYRQVATVVLYVDDLFMSRRGMPEAVLREKLAKAESDLGSLWADNKRLRGIMNRINARVNERERAAEAKVKAADAIAAKAEGWRHASAGYARQNAILRAQLEAHGIDIDPACR